MSIKFASSLRMHFQSWFLRDVIIQTAGPFFINVLNVVVALLASWDLTAVLNSSLRFLIELMSMRDLRS